MILVSDVLSGVQSVTGFGPHSIRGPARYRKLVRARQAGMYVARKLTNRSLPVIGRSFSRDHTTVIHALRVVPRYMSESEAFAALVDEIEQAAIRRTEARAQRVVTEVYYGA